ncbi:DHHW family protein [Paenibacillus ginsengihumi]|uniref:DHHW family protein n=1 Tax=Paenibacillus ginsengihumi TaxID=431596 RepID=UPI0003632543|nr:DHHW family protein [Paenibacillus ginsengihumi]
MTTNNFYRNAVALILMLFVGTIAVLHPALPDRGFSESENRVLEPLPPFSLSSLLSGKFASRYEKYVADQFAFRDVWIGLKTDADRAMGRKDSNGVYLGEDGYLIAGFAPPAEGDAEEKAAAIHSFDRATPGVRKYMMLAPTAAAVYRDKLPAYAPAGDELAYMERIRKLLSANIRFVDVYPALYAERERPVYYKTDHHWTTQGAYTAYRELCKQMGVIPKDEEDFRIRQVTNAFYGSLYSKSGFRHMQPDGISLYLPKKETGYTVEYADEGQTTHSLYAMEKLEGKDKYQVFLGGNHPLIRITASRPTGGKLLVVKDSYANSLIPFLAGHFSEIYVVDLRYFDGSLTKLVEQHDIRDVLMVYNIHTFFEDSSIKYLKEE